MSLPRDRLALAIGLACILRFGVMDSSSLRHLLRASRLADAARRHDHLDLASHRLLQVTNPCLQQLTKNYFARFADMNDQRWR